MLLENEKTLDERFKGLKEKINSCEKDSTLTFRDGRLFYKEIELDKKDENEITINIKPFDTVFVYGFGQGNLIEKLSKKFPAALIVVFEYNPALLKIVLENKNVSEILNSEKIIPIILEKENLTQNMSDLMNFLKQRLTWGNIFQYTASGYEKAEFYDLEAVKAALFKNYSPIVLNRNTLIANSAVIGENMIRNIPNIIKGRMIDSLAGLFKGKPAVIAASGPSLSKNIGLINDIKEKALIIAADSVINTLNIENIEPDIICGVDYQHLNLEKYRSILEAKKRSEAFYVYESAVHYSIPKLFKNTAFDYDSGFIMGAYKEIAGEIKLKRFVTNAVTHLAVLTAYIAGANPIIFIGQDWAYSSGMDHAKGASVEASLPDNVVWVKGNYQNKVATDATLYSGLKLVEDIVAELKKEDVAVVNATEGGAFIEGTKLMSFKEASDIYMNKKIEKDALFKTREPDYDSFINKTEQVRSTLNGIIKDASKGARLDNQILKKWRAAHSNRDVEQLVSSSNNLNDKITFDKIFSDLVSTFYFKDFFYFYQKEMDIAGQKTDERIRQSSKYFNMIKKKTSRFVKYVDELLAYLKLEKMLHSGRQKFFGNIDNILKLAEAYFNFKDLYAGLEMLDEALYIYPDSASLYYWKAKLFGLNRFSHKEALESYKHALEISPDFKKARFDCGVENYKVQSHLILAKQALQRKEYVRAKMLVKRALDYEPENIDIAKWLKIINEYAAYDKDKKRQKILFQQLNMEDDASKEYQKTVDLVKSGRMDEAYENLIKLYKDYGMFGDVPFLLGSISMDRGLIDEAEKYLSEAVELIPYQPLVYAALGKLCLMKEEYAGAKEYLEKAVKMSEKLKPELNDTIGNLCYQFEEYDKALESFHDFLPYSSDKKKTITKIALCYKEMGKIEEYNILISRIRELESAN